jgi:hypothetical protein
VQTRSRKEEYCLQFTLTTTTTAFFGLLAGKQAAIDTDNTIQSLLLT